MADKPQQAPTEASNADSSEDPVENATADSASKQEEEEYVSVVSPSSTFAPSVEDRTNQNDSIDRQDGAEEEDSEDALPEDGAEGLQPVEDPENVQSLKEDIPTTELQPETHEEDPEKLRALEEMHLGSATEVFLFPSSSTTGWDNLRWMSLSGSRRVSFSRIVFRRTKEQFKLFSLIKSSISILFPARLLVLYEKPSILLLLRRANDLEELSEYTAIDYENDPEPESILKHYWIAESVVDLATTKLRLSALTTHFTSEIVGNIKHERERSVFEIVSPTENQIILSAVQVRDNAKDKQELSFTDSGAFMETTSTESALVQAICQAHALAGHSTATTTEATPELDAIWKHQVILGTLHSFVLSGNTKSLEEALERAWRKLNNIKSGTDEDEENELLGKPRTLPERIVDAEDDDGRPPLYYACKRSMNDAMSLLIRYGANPAYQTPEPDCESLLHICASNRNDKGLTTLLSVHSRPGCQPNVVNGLGYTPLCTAVVLGQNSSDREALESCIQVLKSNGGSLFPASNVVIPRFQHPLLVLSLGYRHSDLAVLLEHLDFRFPLSGNMDVVTRKTAASVRVVGQSLSSLYSWPVHQMLANLYQHVKSGGNVPAPKENIVKTLRLLLQCGFEPNERLENTEAADIEREETDIASLFAGFAPIQILAATALELEQAGPKLRDSLYGDFDAIVSILSEELVKHGARLSLDPPPFERRRSKSSSPHKQASSSIEDQSVDETIGADRIDRASLKVDANDHLLQLMGGKERLRKAQTIFSDLGSVMLDPTHTHAPLREDSSAIEDSDVPGGNNEKSCASCWKVFGALVNRKHRCRISWRHVCDECSTKRVIANSKDHRISDGQYLRARALVEKQALKPTPRQPSNRLRASLSVSPAENSQARLQRLEAEEKANRDSLFGGDVMEQASNFLFGTEKEEAEDVNGLTESLGQTRNALLERGDKLSSLSDKTAEMVSASEDFANLATQLRKQSERGFFW